MKRIAVLVFGAVLLFPSAAVAEFRDIDLTIFGMD
jgi:hypothetical protein